MSNDLNDAIYGRYNGPKLGELLVRAMEALQKPVPPAEPQGFSREHQAAATLFNAMVEQRLEGERMRDLTLLARGDNRGFRVVALPASGGNRARWVSNPANMKGVVRETPGVVEVLELRGTEVFFRSYQDGKENADRALGIPSSARVAFTAAGPAVKDVAFAEMGQSRAADPAMKEAVTGDLQRLAEACVPGQQPAPGLR